LSIEGTPISETDKLEDNTLLFEIMELHEEIQDSEDKNQISNILDTTRGLYIKTLQFLLLLIFN
jgi:hypothetical protein